jgi:hypothetical protein
VSPSPGEGRGRWKPEAEVVVEPGVVRAAPVGGLTLVVVTVPNG